MSKKKRKNQHQESIETLQKRLDDYINDNFRVKLEKTTLLQENEDLRGEKDNLEKEKEIIKQMMKINSIILIVMSQFLNLCNSVDFAGGIKRVISDYIIGMLEEMHKMPGNLNPADFDPKDDDDYYIDLEYDDEDEYC